MGENFGQELVILILGIFICVYSDFYYQKFSFKIFIGFVISSMGMFIRRSFRFTKGLTIDKKVSKKCQICEMDLEKSILHSNTVAKCIY